MARELLSLLDNRPEEFQPSPVAPPGPNFTRSNAFLSADDAMPDLGRFITVESFLIFNILGTSSDVLRTWLSAPADTWSFDPNSPNFYDGFAHLHLFALNCHWTNDAAERSVLKKLNCLFYQKKLLGWLLFWKRGCQQNMVKTPCNRSWLSQLMKEQGLGEERAIISTKMPCKICSESDKFSLVSLVGKYMLLWYLSKH